MALKPMTLGQASKFTSPNPLTLVCTQTPERKTNLAAVSWWTYLSFNPNLIGFAMNKASYSGEMVRQNQKVALAMPGKDLAQAGRDADKAEKFGIDLTSLPDCPIQVPVHSRVVIQCSLQQTVEAGDHYLYLCAVDQVYGDPAEQALFAWNGYAKLAGQTAPAIL